MRVFPSMFLYYFVVLFLVVFYGLGFELGVRVFVIGGFWCLLGLHVVEAWRFGLVFDYCY